MSTNREGVKKYRELNLGEVSLPICFDHVEGAYLADREGNRYLDFTSGYGVTSTGWLRPEIRDAIHDQLQRSAYAPPWLPTPEAIALGELLLSITSLNLVKCARATGGADANEIIFKAVYAATGKKGVLSFHRSYHGGTRFALAISDAEEFHLPQLPTGNEMHQVEPPYCFRCPFGKHPSHCRLECTQAIEKLFAENKDIGCFFLEPVIGSGGVIVPPPDYLKRVRALCDQYGVFLVFDEVLTGFGRIGSLTAAGHFGVRPDAISFAKGMSAGYAAIGAALLCEELAKGVKATEDVSSTFAWTPLACRIAQTNIELIIRERLHENADKQGAYLQQRLRELFDHYLPGRTIDIRGMGLLIGIEPVKDPVSKTPDTRLVRQLIISAFRKGLLLCASWDFRVLVLMPPLNISKASMEDGLDRLERALSAFTLIPQQDAMP